MIITFSINGNPHHADLSKPLDISLPLTSAKETVDAFYIPPVVIEPLSIGDFIGDVLGGGPCNVNTITFNPHGNGTHTETVGHISKEKEAIHDCLKRFWHLADLVSVEPSKIFDDWVIMPDQLNKVLEDSHEALVIRTRPNPDAKKTRKYSGSNPVYLHAETAQLIASAGVKHLLIDIPSVDKEEDGGKLLAHRAFWQYPQNTRKDATITEFIFVPDHINDGLYLLNLQIISLMNDASPSKPLLYSIWK